MWIFSVQGKLLDEVQGIGGMNAHTSPYCIRSFVILIASIPVVPRK